GGSIPSISGVWSSARYWRSPSCPSSPASHRQRIPGTARHVRSSRGSPRALDPWNRFDRGERDMQLGMVGLGRMGANMVRRLMRKGHECVVFDASPAAAQGLVREGALSADSFADLARRLHKPRAVWLMVPAAAVDATIAGLTPHLEAGDVLIDGGNSYYVDDIRRARELCPRGIHYVDVGTSGGVWG